MFCVTNGLSNENETIWQRWFRTSYIWLSDSKLLYATKIYHK